MASKVKKIRVNDGTVVSICDEEAIHIEDIAVSLTDGSENKVLAASVGPVINRGFNTLAGNVSDLSETSSTLSASVDTISTQVNSYNETIANLSANVQALSGQVELLSTRINDKDETIRVLSSQVFCMTKQDYMSLDLRNYDSALGSGGSFSLQSACLNTDTDHFVILFNTSGDGGPSYILEVDRNFSYVSTHYADLYHANDITYHPSTGKYYVAPIHNNGTLYKLNSNFEIEDTIVLNGIDRELTQVSFDGVDSFYVTTSWTFQTYKCNEDFSSIELYADQSNLSLRENEYTNIYSYDLQGSTCYKSNFVTCSWFWRTSGDGITRIGVFNGITQDCYFKYDYTHGLNDEPEGLVTIGDVIYVFSYVGNTLNVRKLYMNSILPASVN